MGPSPTFIIVTKCCWDVVLCYPEVLAQPSPKCLLFTNGYNAYTICFCGGVNLWLGRCTTTKAEQFPAAHVCTKIAVGANLPLKQVTKAILIH